MNWDEMALGEKLEFLKDQNSEDEFFLIWNGAWCAGYMKTPGVVPEMDVSMEVFGDSIDEAISALREKLYQNR